MGRRQPELLLSSQLLFLITEQNDSSPQHGCNPETQCIWCVLISIHHQCQGFKQWSQSRGTVTLILNHSLHLQRAKALCSSASKHKWQYAVPIKNHFSDHISTGGIIADTLCWGFGRRLLYILCELWMDRGVIITYQSNHRSVFYVFFHCSICV